MMLLVNRSDTDHQLLSQRLQSFYGEQWRSERALSCRPELRMAESTALNRALLKQRLSRLPFVGRYLRRITRLWRALTSADTRLRDKLMAVPVLGPFTMWLWGIFRFLSFKYEALTMIRQLDGQLTALQTELKNTRKQLAVQAREIQQLRALIESRSAGDDSSI